MQRLAGRIGLAFATATTLAGFAFFALYLFRWEWHRALIAGVILIVAEVAVGVGVVLRRLGRSDAGRDTALPGVVGSRREIDLRWLDRPDDRYGVFIPLLLGGGALVSAVAWVVERLAKGTSGAESSLPRHYRAIALPDDPLVPRDDEVRVRGLPEADDEHLRRLLGPGR